MADLTLYVNYMIKKTDQQEQQLQANTVQQKKLEAKHQKELIELTKAKSNLEKQMKCNNDAICLTFELSTTL